MIVENGCKAAYLEGLDKGVEIRDGEADMVASGEMAWVSYR